MRKRLYATLTPKHPGSSGQTTTLGDLIEALEQYKVELENKSKEFIERLLDVGISIAESNKGPYGQYIIFTKEIKTGVNGYVGALIARDGQKVVKEWYVKDGVDGYEVSPILMAEFGSGWLSQVMFNIQGVGQGTMPNAKGHANDPNGWWWEDSEGKHHSYGEAPTMPMYHADIAMITQVDRIAREVFLDG